MKKLTKKQTGIAVVVAAAIITFGGTYAYGQSQSAKKSKEAKQELTVSTNKLVELDKQIIALLDSKDSNYLAKDVKFETISSLRKQTDKETKVDTKENRPKVDYEKFNEESKTVQKDMTDVETAYKTQTTLNSLFRQTDKEVAMNGSDVKKDLPIADHLQMETVNAVKKDYYKEKSEVPYDKTVNELIINAETQMNQLEKAKLEVAKVYKDDKVISTDTTLYDSAKVETDKIKNEKAKKNLTDQLAKVKADIDKKASEEKAKADAITQAAAAKETTNAQNNAPIADTTNQGGTAATTADNGATAAGGYTDNGAGTNNGGGYTPPTTGEGSTGGGSATPQTPSRPSTGGNPDGSLTQDQLDKAAEDAGNADWSGFFK